MKTYPYILLLAALVVLLQSCSKEPESCFAAAVNGRVATFSSACAVDAETWSWDFGDGTSSDLQNPTHTYSTSTSRAYIVSLTAGNKRGGKTHVSSQTINVTPEINEKFSGAYQLTEQCTSGPDSYTVTVSPKSGTTNQAIFTGLYASGFPVTATVGSDGVSFTIARQALFSSWELSSANGTISADGNTINLYYNFYQAGDLTASDGCLAYLTK